MSSSSEKQRLLPGSNVSGTTSSGATKGGGGNYAALKISSSGGEEEGGGGRKGTMQQRSKLQEYRGRTILFVDPTPPLLASFDGIHDLDGEQRPGMDDHSEFKYLIGHHTRGIFGRVLREGVEGVESKKYLIIFLIIIATYVMLLYLIS
jgi:hypothetical protein